jgi:hypothetical protein
MSTACGTIFFPTGVGMADVNSLAFAFKRCSRLPDWFLMMSSPIWIVDIKTSASGFSFSQSRLVDPSSPKGGK